MSSKTTVLGVMLAMTLVYSPLARAQQPAGSSDWGSVQALPPGDDLIVKLKDGRSVEGKLNSVTDAELSLTRNNKSETFGRDRIFQIYGRKRKAEKGKYAAIGAGVGLGIGLAKNSPRVDDGEIYATIGTPLGAGIGAIGGFLFGQAKRKRVLIYQAN
jgi:small nuclear ribonucleoprotein (snRNP)-like protein